MALVVKNTAASAGDLRHADLISALGRSIGGGHGNPLHYSGLENPMDRGAWWVMALGLERVIQNWSDWVQVHTFLTYIRFSYEDTHAHTQQICLLTVYIIFHYSLVDMDHHKDLHSHHFLFYTFIERTTERWTKFTKQLLIASSGH